MSLYELYERFKNVLNHVKEYASDIKPSHYLPIALKNIVKDLKLEGVSSIADHLQNACNARRANGTNNWFGSGYLNYQYHYDYPICWFRSLPFMLMFDTRLNKLLSNKLVKLEASKNATHEYEDLIKVFEALLCWADLHCNTVPQTGSGLRNPLALYKVLSTAQTNARKKTNVSNSSLTLEHVMIYLCRLLGYSMIKAGFPTRYQKRVFDNYLPNISNISVFQTQLVNNKNLVVDNIEPSTSIKPTQILPSDSKPDVVVVFYKKEKIGTNTDNDLAIYVKHNEQYYALTSFSITSYVDTIDDLLSIGHNAPFFSCNGKIWTSEKFIAADDSLVFGKVDFFEKVLLGYTEIQTGITTLTTQVYKRKSCPFNFNRYERTGVYLPILLDFDPEEIIKMQEMVKCIQYMNTLTYLRFEVNGKKDVFKETLVWRNQSIGDYTELSNKIVKALAILCYFTKSMTFQVWYTDGTPQTTQMQAKVWCYRSGNMCTWMYGNVDSTDPGLKAKNPIAFLQAEHHDASDMYSFIHYKIDPSSKKSVKEPLINCIGHIELMLKEIMGSKTLVKLKIRYSNVKLRNAYHDQVFTNVLGYLCAWCHCNDSNLELFTPK